MICYIAVRTTLNAFSPVFLKVSWSVCKSKANVHSFSIFECQNQSGCKSRAAEAHIQN